MLTYVVLSDGSVLAGFFIGVGVHFAQHLTSRERAREDEVGKLVLRNSPAGHIKGRIFQVLWDICQSSS